MTHLTPLGHLFYGRTKYSIWRHTITASIVIAFCLTTVTMTLDLVLSHQLSFYSYFGLGSIAYLIAVRWFFIKNKTALARWLIIALLGCTALVTLFLWGINTIPGMLALGLSVILPGLLFGSKHITPIAIPLILCLITIYVIHETQLYTPDTQHLSEPASPIDVVVYGTLLLALSFTTWLSVRRSEYTLERARHAEKKLRTQKSTLKAQLIQESVKLRNNQLKEIQQLYDFAVLGQNTTATLHELSNHLSVLSMDIESLHDTNEHSQAIKNVEESLRQVTAMVRAVRQKLNNYNPGGVFQPHKTLLATLREIRPSTTSATIRHQTNPLFNRQTQIKGDPLALSHIISIILKNALEACSHLPDAKIQTSISQTKATVRITVSDNGPGIPPHLTPQLFSPVVSSKPSGLGAGLFIAHTLAKTQFNGTLRLSEGSNSSLSGASFLLELPIKR